MILDDSDYSSEDSEYIEAFKDGIRLQHTCESTHIYSAEVLEVLPGHVVWDCIVEVFELHDHRQAKRVYAWRVKEGDRMKFISILEIPPVESPNAAVEAFLADSAGF